MLQSKRNLVMRELKAIPWSTVAVLAILAVLIALGHNGVITSSLAAIVGVYLGVEWRASRRRPPDGR